MPPANKAGDISDLSLGTDGNFIFLKKWVKLLIEVRSLSLVIFDQKLITIIEVKSFKTLINKALFDFYSFHRYLSKPTKELVISKQNAALE